jgi:hypothetical protein
MLSCAHLLDFILNDAMTKDVEDIPVIPKEATNVEHENSVTQRVTRQPVAPYAYLRAGAPAQAYN